MTGSRTVLLLNSGTIAPVFAVLLLDELVEEGALLKEELLDFDDESDEEDGGKDEERDEAFDDDERTELALDSEELKAELSDELLLEKLLATEELLAGDELLRAELLLELLTAIEDDDDAFELELGATTTAELADDDSELLATLELATTDELDAADDFELKFDARLLAELLTELFTALLTTKLADELAGTTGGDGCDEPPPPPPQAVNIIAMPTAKHEFVAKFIRHHPLFFNKFVSACRFRRQLYAWRMVPQWLANIFPLLQFKTTWNTEIFGDGFE